MKLKHQNIQESLGAIPIELLAEIKVLNSEEIKKENSF